MDNLYLRSEEAEVLKMTDGDGYRAVYKSVNPEVRDSLSYLCERGFCEFTILNSRGEWLWKITTHGKTALQCKEDAAKQHTYEERQNRFNNKIGIINMIIPFIIFTLGVIVGNYTGIVNFIYSFFTAFFHD